MSGFLAQQFTFGCVFFLDLSRLVKLGLIDVYKSVYFDYFFMIFSVLIGLAPI